MIKLLENHGASDLILLEEDFYMQINPIKYNLHSFRFVTSMMKS